MFQAGTYAYNFRMRALCERFPFVLVLLWIEFLDELLFGAREATWSIIRSDLNLTYIQIGMLLSIPNLLGNLIESAIGILGDFCKRLSLIIGGGIFYILALLLAALSKNFGFYCWDSLCFILRQVLL